MNKDVAENIAIAIEQLALADELSVSDGVSSHFLQILKGDGSETVVQGNAEGLVYLALSILRLATKQAGSHQHFDESGVIDKCEIPMVIARCIAEWEE